MPTPVMTPLFRDPLWGGLSFGASKSRFVFLVDSLIAGVRKTQEDVLNVFISIKAACKQIKIWGNRLLTTTKHNIYLYISEW